MVEIRVTDLMPIVNMKLMDISKYYPSSILIAAVLRDNEAIIPRGDFQIKTDDIIYVIGQPSSVTNFCKKIRLYVQKVKSVMVIGGGRIAYYLTKSLEETGMRVKIIELDYDKCVSLTELLPETLIINGDGSDEKLLESENLSEMSAFISLTNRDEDNFMSALLAKQANVPKVITKISKNNYLNLIKNLGIDSIINPSLITTNLILKFVRGLKNALGNQIESLYRIINNQAEAVEFTIKEKADFLDVPLKNLKIHRDILVAVIVRKNEIIIPHGNDSIHLGDSVIFIAKNKQISDLSDIITTGGVNLEL